MDQKHSDLDRAVRLHIYRHFVATSRPPTTAETALALDQESLEVAAAYHRLAASHIIVLQPGGDDIWMAMPFSSIPTAFRVTAGDRWWWANCGWDALGIPAMLDMDAQIETDCTDCGEPLTLHVVGGALQERAGCLHFAVPAARWWDDIGFT